MGCVGILREPLPTEPCPQVGGISCCGAAASQPGSNGTPLGFPRPPMPVVNCPGATSRGGARSSTATLGPSRRSRGNQPSSWPNLQGTTTPNGFLDVVWASRARASPDTDQCSRSSWALQDRFIRAPRTRHHRVDRRSYRLLANSHILSSFVGIGRAQSRVPGSAGHFASTITLVTFAPHGALVADHPAHGTWGDRTEHRFERVAQAGASGART